MNRTTKLEQVPVGTTFKVWGKDFTVLDKGEGRIFVLAAELDSDMPFRREDNPSDAPYNDFRASDIKDYLNGPYLEKLAEAGADISNDLLEFEVDLKCTLGQHEYGSCTVKAGLLTLEEYGEYYDIIPFADDWWWLATPWATPLRSPYTSYTNGSWRVLSNGGCGNYYCSYSGGVRPALTLNPSLLVSWESYEKDESDNDSTDNWDNYIKYLHKWAVEHDGKEFAGCSPASYDEWRNNEGDDNGEV